MKNIFIKSSVLIVVLFLLVNCSKGEIIFRPTNQIDTDKDGVFDIVDICPNTPSGETVDPNDGCTKSPIYLDSNEITIKCFEWGQIGQTGEVDGITYTIVNRFVLENMVKNGEDVTKVCTTNVTDMSDIFGGSPFNQEINSWDVSNVTNMSDMFGDSPFNQDISSWEVSIVTNMSYMFSGTPFNQDLSGWDVSNVTNMIEMFSDSQFDKDISSWDVSNVTNMSNMFYENLQFNQDLSSWNVINVTICNGFSQGAVLWISPKPNFTNCNPN